MQLIAIYILLDISLARQTSVLTYQLLFVVASAEGSQQAVVGVAVLVS